MRKFGVCLIVATTVIAGGEWAHAQDAAKGEQAFAVCKACHSLEQNMVGPKLAGVIGRKAASAEGFEYSDLLKAAGAAGLTWTDAEMTAYLKGPTKYLTDYVKGKGKEASGSSKMSFGVSNETKRKDIAVYLAQQK